MIELPDRACHDYLRSFGLGCIFVTAKGAIGTGSDLVHADNPVIAWWCSSRRSAETRRAMLLVAGDKSGQSGKLFYRRLIATADKRFDAHLKLLSARKRRS
jgi:hypothetical protein